MILNRAVKWVRKLDTRRRQRHPGRAILVNSRTAMNYAVMAPVFRTMQSDPRITFYFAASENPASTRVIYPDENWKLLISARRAALMKFDAYLVADLLWMTLPRATRRVLMFHGVAGKYSNVYDTPDRSMRDWDRLFFINHRRMRNFVSTGAIDYNGHAGRLVGYPKVDCLVDGSLDRASTLLGLGLDPGTRTVLYAPTWSPHSSLNAMGEELVKLLCKAGYTVIVKLHDRSSDPEYIHSGGIDWAARLGPILRSNMGHLAENSDACPYLVAADVLITDHSSVGFEYLLLDRPVVRIDMPSLIGATHINPEYVGLLAEASTSVRDARGAVQAVEHSFAESGRQSKSRRAVADELFYQPGTATQRAVLEMYEVLELAPR